MILLALGHAISPQHIALDWPDVSLLIIGAALLFSKELSAGLPYLKKLKLGEAEIELKEKLDDLNTSLNKIEEKPPKTGPTQSIVEKLADTSIESKVLEIAAKDKGAALVALSIEIEKELALLCKKNNISLSRGTWREMIEILAAKRVLNPELTKPLLEFRDVRNRVIHSGLHGPVWRTLLDSALDSGLKLLRLLKEIGNQS